MAGGITRREIIKRSAAAGAVAWTAPMIIDGLSTRAGADVISGCSGIKITPGTSNHGNLEICDAFDTGGPDLSCLVPGGATAFTATQSFPGGFWTIKLCGLLATGLTGMGVKSAGNIQHCDVSVGGIVQQGAECYENHNGPNGVTPYPATATPVFPYSISGDAQCNFNGRVGHVVVLYPLGAGAAGPVTIPGDTATYPALGDPGAGCRWMFVDILPNINAVGLQVCFTLISPPAGCGQ